MQINFEDARADLVKKIDTLIVVLQRQKEYFENVTYDELKDRYAGTDRHINYFYSEIKFVVNEINIQYGKVLSWLQVTDEQLKVANKVKEVFNLVREYETAYCPSDVNFIKLVSKALRKG